MSTPGSELAARYEAARARKGLSNQAVAILARVYMQFPGRVKKGLTDRELRNPRVRRSLSKIAVLLDAPELLTVWPVLRGGLDPGGQLERARLAKGLSKDEVARRIGTSALHISRVELDPWTYQLPPVVWARLLALLELDTLIPARQLDSEENNHE